VTGLRCVFLSDMEPGPARCFLQGSSTILPMLVLAPLLLAESLPPPSCESVSPLLTCIVGPIRTPLSFKISVSASFSQKPSLLTLDRFPSRSLLLLRFGTPLSVMGESDKSWWVYENSTSSLIRAGRLPIPLA